MKRRLTTLLVAAGMLFVLAGPATALPGDVARGCDNLNEQFVPEPILNYCASS